MSYIKSSQQQRNPQKVPDSQKTNVPETKSQATQACMSHVPSLFGIVYRTLKGTSLFLSEIAHKLSHKFYQMDECVRDGFFRQ